MPDTGKVQEALQRPQRGMNRLEWDDDDPGVELFAPEDAEDHREYSYVTADWARRWPSEEIWRARKRD